MRRLQKIALNGILRVRVRGSDPDRARGRRGGRGQPPLGGHILQQLTSNSIHLHRLPRLSTPDYCKPIASSARQMDQKSTSSTEASPSLLDLHGAAAKYLEIGAKELSEKASVEVLEGALATDANINHEGIL